MCSESVFQAGANVWFAVDWSAVKWEEQYALMIEGARKRLRWFQEGLALGETICYTFRQLKTLAAHLSIRRKTGKRPKSEKRYERKNRNQPECLSWQSGD